MALEHVLTQDTVPHCTDMLLIITAVLAISTVVERAVVVHMSMQGGTCGARL